jgi:hypothetical protein
MFGCGTLFLESDEQKSLTVFEDEMLRRIFRRKRDKVTG